jgi:hypothetical protein
VGAQPAFNCTANHGGNSGPPTLSFQVPNNSGAVKTNYCVATGVGIENSNGSGQGPAIMLSASSPNVKFYPDPATCGDGTGEITGPISFPAGSNFVQLFMKTSDPAGTQFSAQISTTATGWAIQPAQFTVVADALQLSMVPPQFIPPGSCQYLFLQTALYVFFSTSTIFELDVGVNQMGGNNNGPPPLPGIKIYSDAACTTEIAPQSQDPNDFSGQISFLLNFPTPSMMHESVYYRDNTTESLNFGLSATDNSIEPLGGGLNIAVDPFSVNYSPNALVAVHSAAFSSTPVVTNGSITSCYSPSGLPSGLSVNAVDCTISGTPTTPQGAAPYTISALDSSGTSLTINITIQIN